MGTILGSRQISNFLGNKPNYFRGARERGGPQYHVGNGLGLLIRIGDSIRHEWVKENKWSINHLKR